MTATTKTTTKQRGGVLTFCWTTRHMCPFALFLFEELVHGGY